MIICILIKYIQCHSFSAKYGRFMCAFQCERCSGPLKTAAALHGHLSLSLARIFKHCQFYHSSERELAM